MTGIIVSNPPLVEQPPGQSSANPAGLPGVTYTAAVVNLPQTWRALQTFPGGTISIQSSDITPSFADLESFAGSSSTTKLLAAIASGALYVQLTQDITLTQQIDLPINFTLDGNGHFINQGASVTQLFTMDDSSRITNARINGAGGSFTGKTINISAGNYQRLVNVDIAFSDGFCLDFAADKGQNFAWVGGSAQRFVSTNPAIRTVSESQTSGGRYFNNINMNGGWGYDIGGHYTVIQGGSMLNLTFRSTSSYAKITGTRIASAPTIIGANHEINAVFDAGVTLGDNSGTYPNGTSLVQSWIMQQYGLTITDHSNNNTNMIQSLAGNTSRIYGAGGNFIAWEMYQAGSIMFRIGSDASNNPYITTQNGLPLGLGINSVNYFNLASDGGLISTGVTGGSKGANTINAANVFVKGAPIGVILGGYAIGVSLNAVADTAIAIASAYANYRIQAVLIQNTGSVASLTTAQFGLFSAVAGGGTALIATGTALSGITSNAANTAGNETVFNSNAAVWNFTTVQFRCTQVQSAGATVNVYVFIQPLPAS